MEASSVAKTALGKSSLIKTVTGKNMGGGGTYGSPGISGNIYVVSAGQTSGGSGDSSYYLSLKTKISNKGEHKCGNNMDATNSKYLAVGAFFSSLQVTVKGSWGSGTNYGNYFQMKYIQC